jgi:hypothetical protein
MLGVRKHYGKVHIGKEGIIQYVLSLVVREMYNFPCLVFVKIEKGKNVVFVSRNPNNITFGKDKLAGIGNDRGSSMKISNVL